MASLPAWSSNCPLRVFPFSSWSSFSGIRYCLVYNVSRLLISGFKMAVILYKTCNSVPTNKHCPVWFLRWNKWCFRFLSDNEGGWNCWWNARRFKEVGSLRSKLLTDWSITFLSNSNSTEVLPRVLEISLFVPLALHGANVWWPFGTNVWYQRFPFPKSGTEMTQILWSSIPCKEVFYPS